MMQVSCTYPASKIHETLENNFLGFFSLKRTKIVTKISKHDENYSRIYSLIITHRAQSKARGKKIIAHVS